MKKFTFFEYKYTPYFYTTKRKRFFFEKNILSPKMKSFRASHDIIGQLDQGCLCLRFG